MPYLLLDAVSLCLEMLHKKEEIEYPIFKIRMSSLLRIVDSTNRASLSLGSVCGAPVTSLLYAQPDLDAIIKKIVKWVFQRSINFTTVFRH